MIDFTPVHTARLKPGDLSKLCSVSRCTCSMWLNGHAQPHHLHGDRVAKVLDGITAATKAGLLPVPYNILRRERAHYIQSAIEQATADPDAAS